MEYPKLKQLANSEVEKNIVTILKYSKLNSNISRRRLTSKFTIRTASCKVNKLGSQISCGQNSQGILCVQVDILYK
jgi:hypothetical protein